MTENDTATVQAPDTDVEDAGGRPPATPAAPVLRDPAVRRRRRRRLGIAVAVLLALLWWLGWHSQVTLVKHVVVDSPRGISAESIRLASGISPADHVPSVDADAVRLGIMESIPAVADVKLERSMPDTIRLEVIARTPLAAVASGSAFYIMDAEGVIFDKVGRSEGLPVIRAATDVDRENARNLLMLVPDDLRKRIIRVSAKSRDDITLGLRSGAIVRWGSLEDSDLKARVLAGLMAVKATRYDVSAPLLPTTSGSPESSTTTG